MSQRDRLSEIDVGTRPRGTTFNAKNNKQSRFETRFTAMDRSRDKLNNEVADS